MGGLGWFGFLHYFALFSVVIVIFSCYFNYVFDICNIFTYFLTLFHKYSLKKKNLIFYSLMIKTSVS